MDFARAAAVRRLGRSYKGWPAAGSYSHGSFSEPPTLEHLTGASGSSSLQSRGPVWPTPKSGRADQETTHKGGNPTLAKEAVQTDEAVRKPSWSTPRASDGAKGGPNMKFGAGGIPLPSQVVQMMESAWPTPSARDWKDGHASETTLARNSRPLNEEAVAWPTPTTRMTTGASETETRRGGPDLQTRAEQWPTPTAKLGDARRGMPSPTQGQKRLQGRRNLDDMVSVHDGLQAQRIHRPGTKSWPDGQTSRRRLNTRFVEWLMGFPPGWTEIRCPATTRSEPLATPSSLSKRKPRSSSSGNTSREGPE
jgi:hypothetical protein